MRTEPSTAAQSAAPKRGGVSPQPMHAAEVPDALLTMRNAAAITGVSQATIYRLAKADPTFPRLVRLGARCTRIRAGDLTSWLARKAAAA